MGTTSPVDAALRRLPAVHVLVDDAARLGDAPRWAVVAAARRAIAARRAAILAAAAGVGPGGDTLAGDIADPGDITPAAVAAVAHALARPSLRRVINATGVVLHTNLGRAPLAPAALAAVIEVGRGYSNLEYELDEGARGSRHGHLVASLRELTGAEDAVVVNNNAAACLVALAALAAGREVIVSRGELIEIGGSFRVPDILRASGCRLVEVGTTNKTRLADYADAITADTALLLKVHRSNFAMVGFTEEVEADELAALAAVRERASMIDLGSGALLDEAARRAIGLGDEPSVAAAVATGVDVVCFSGDKLLGGPQAGIIAGRAAAIARVRAHPLIRAMRPDKMTIAALAATLAMYRDGRAREVPAIAMLGASEAALKARAERLVAMIAAGAGGVRLLASVIETRSAVGGGALPRVELPSWAVALSSPSRAADTLDARLRAAEPPVVARIADGAVVLDVRTIADDELAEVAAAVRGIA
jgi:L-seryl-tRNA(Ser) seleniumtransferase